MDLFGVGIYSLIIYIAAVLVISVVLKRRMAEAMLWTFIIIVVIGGMFSDKSAWTLTKDGLLDAAKQEVVYASMAFVFMAFMMERTGVINRLITDTQQHPRTLRGRLGLRLDHRERALRHGLQ